MLAIASLASTAVFTATASPVVDRVARCPIRRACRFSAAGSTVFWIIGAICTAPSSILMMTSTRPTVLSLLERFISNQKS